MDLYFSATEVTLNRTLNKSCHSPKSENEIHIFVDASAVAVTAVSYLKTVHNLATDVETCYIIGKSKVAPIEQISIPKLELEAAVIEVHLLSTIMKESSFHITRSTLWTDSQVVLDWLSKTKKQPVLLLIGSKKSLHQLMITNGNTLPPKNIQLTTGPVVSIQTKLQPSG